MSVLLRLEARYIHMDNPLSLLDMLSALCIRKRARRWEDHPANSIRGQDH
jgi:hypothetical protein